VSIFCFCNFHIFLIIYVHVCVPLCHVSGVYVSHVGHRCPVSWLIWPLLSRIYSSVCYVPIFYHNSIETEVFGCLLMPGNLLLNATRALM
jgi:hypothetical protein